MAITQEKWNELEARMKALDIHEADIVEKFILGSGKGGQKINKTSSCVYIKHTPTGIEIKCQRDRMRETNRFLARRELCEKIEEKIYLIKSKKAALESKVRRQKQRRSRRQKLKLVESKRELSAKKTLRKKPVIEEK